jgi:hypothetical protein
MTGARQKEVAKKVLSISIDTCGGRPAIPEKQTGGFLICRTIVSKKF